MRSLTVLGATGSIGRQTLDVAGRYPEKFKIKALAAGRNAQEMFALARKFKPEICALIEKPDEIPEDLKNIDWYFGPDSACLATKAAAADDVLCAIVGIAGLDAVLTALDTGKRVLLANKEALVTGGSIITDKANRLNKQLIPVDSEHSAIYQCLKASQGNKPSRIILTCSGGALRELTKQQIDNARVEDVLKHPTWSMGNKITVDCATLMNKGLEVIEAYYLFNMPLKNIDVVIHPQSVVHSMVEFEDGAVLAQLGLPDMRLPIGYALGEPQRLPFGGGKLDFEKMCALTFKKPDTDRFPCLAYAREALEAGGNMPVALNAANEVAVSAFLKNEAKFGLIAYIVRRVLDLTVPKAVLCSKEVHEEDLKARDAALKVLKQIS